jgi:hypothetical protein
MTHDFMVVLAYCPAAALSRAGTASRRVLLYRGLRLKAGLDVGLVNSDVHGVSARMTYNGKVGVWHLVPSNTEPSCTQGVLLELAQPPSLPV